MSTVLVTEDKTYVFKAADFTSSTLVSVKISSLPTTGTLMLKGAPVAFNQTVSAGDIAAGNLIFVPNTDVTAVGSFNDVVTTRRFFGSTSTNSTMTLSVAPDAGPSALASAVQVAGNQSYTFKTSDFGYSDAADKTADALGSITVTSLPSDGTLQWKGGAVTLNQKISAADIANGLLIFVPSSNVTAADSFSFKVTDSRGGTTSAATATMTLNITGAGTSDPGPSALASAVQVTEDQTYSFTVTDFGYSDSFDTTTDPLASVTIVSLPATGTLQLSGTNVNAGQVIPADNIPHLTFVPNTDVTAQGSFSFKVTDTTGGITSAAATMTLNVTPDAGPTAQASQIAVTEDVTYHFNAADFGYADTGDLPTIDPLGSIIIVSLPTIGTLKLGATNVTAGQVITAASIPNLTFVPNTDVTAQGSFSFKVADSLGGTTSAAAATMTINVTADAGPSALASAVAATQNQTYVFKIADFGYSDSADVTRDPLGSVAITSLPGNGTLFYNHNGTNTAITSASLGATGYPVSASDISSGNLTFAPATGSTSSGSLSFAVTDSIGGTRSAGTAVMTLNIAAPAPANVSFAAQNFTTVGSDNSGFYMIPPDSNAAVGLNTVITATNGVVEAFTKTGSPLNIFNGSNNQSLNNFFVAGLGSLVLTNFNDPNQSGTFDPKVIYDPYSNRFIAVAMQESDAGGTFKDINRSNILIAVSSPDTGAPLTWTYTSINSDVIAPNGTDCWADYPGLSVDGSGKIYITANLFDHATGNYQGSRLWTISESDIFSGAAGTNATASGKASIYDPSVLSGATAAGSSELFTLMAAEMLPGTGAFSSPSGTYLVSYNGASNAQGKILNVIQVTPQSSGGPTFSYQSINLGNIDAAGQFAGFLAPQKGTTSTLDAGDNRVYSAVFRNGYLYATTIINPTSTYDSANAGKTTAHWVQVDTTNASVSGNMLSGLKLGPAGQGDVSGASIAAGLRTFYPSISVDANGDFAIGFSASGPNNYASAYYEAYKYNSTSNTWTLQNPTLLAAGVAPYFRTFGGGDNRWGDFSSIVADPSSPSTFWVYNEYAMSQGTTISGESGRWATQVGEFSLPNTTTGPVVAGGSGTGSVHSSPLAGLSSPSIANPRWVQLAEAGGHRQRLTSDIDPEANPLVEGDHGPAIGSLPGPDLGRGSLSWQLAGSFSQLVQTMAAFRANHESFASLVGRGSEDPASGGVLAASLFHHHG